MTTPLPGEPLPLDLCNAYDEAAEYVAKVGWFPHWLSGSPVADHIDADPEAFRERANQFRYETAMSSLKTSK